GEVIPNGIETISFDPTKGVSKIAFQKKFNMEMDQVFAKQLQHNQEKGLLEESDEYVRLTRKGKLLGNEVFQSFLID
ncbi:hypothetical protein ACT4UT_06010, partial [Bacillus sp. B-TM1]